MRRVCQAGDRFEGLDVAAGQGQAQPVPLVHLSGQVLDFRHSRRNERGASIRLHAEQNSIDVSSRAQVIQSDFVERRQASHGGEGMSQDDLLFRMTAARCVPPPPFAKEQAGGADSCDAQVDGALVWRERAEQRGVDADGRTGRPAEGADAGGSSAAEVGVGALEWAATLVVVPQQADRDEGGELAREWRGEQLRLRSLRQCLAMIVSVTLMVLIAC